MVTLNFHRFPSVWDWDIKKRAYEKFAHENAAEMAEIAVKNAHKKAAMREELLTAPGTAAGTAAGTPCSQSRVLEID